MKIFQFKFDVALATKVGRNRVCKRLYTKPSYAYYSYKSSNTMKQNLTVQAKSRWKS